MYPSLISKKNDLGSRRQKQPFVRQHFLKRWPEPQGQRSFLPSFSSSNLSPWTIRSPRLNCVSGGPCSILLEPLRRLLIVSKKWLFVELFVICLSHDTPPIRLELRSRTLTVRKGSPETVRRLNLTLIAVSALDLIVTRCVSKGFETKNARNSILKFTTWAWTLEILTDPKSKIELIPDLTDDEKELAGLRVTVSVDPALDMYFDKATHELVRVDWRNDIYRFSEWKEYDGTKYPSKCAMFRRNSGEPWFFHEIVTMERLPELSDGLKR